MGILQKLGINIIIIIIIIIYNIICYYHYYYYYLCVTRRILIRIKCLGHKINRGQDYS